MRYLYHYTTVEKFALILKSKKFRFNTLTALDDVEEGIANVFNVGKYVFISSWMSGYKESIPMWNSYAQLNQGVRIKMPYNMFDIYDELEDQDRHNFDTSQLSTLHDKADKLIRINKRLDNSWKADGKYTFITLSKADFAYDIKYSDEPYYLKPQIISDEDNNFDISLNRMGFVKNKYWKFQNEFRYRLILLPYSFRKLEQSNSLLDLGIGFGSVVSPFSHFDLPVKDECYQQMSVTLSPRISEGNREIVYALRDKYNEKMIIRESKLNERLR